MSFVHLHTHSEHSLLNGAIRVEEMVKKAKEYNFPAVALTDYGNLFGAVDFFLAAKKAGIKPIIGATVFCPSHDQFNLRQHRRGMDYLYQLVLLIQNAKGYHNLCKLITKSYLEGFYYKPRVDSTLLKEHSEGLICLSGGWDGPINQPLVERNREKALVHLEKFSSIFPGRFYVELQENGVEGQKDSNLELMSLAAEKGLPVVATNNCHYMAREDAEAFETLICIQTGATLHGASDRLKFSTDGYYFKSAEEMAADFDYAPEAISNTLKIADLVDFEYDLKTYHFPKFDPPAGKTLDEFLKEEAFRGLDERWEGISTFHKRREPAFDLEAARKIYEARLTQELGIITQTGFAGYFLIVSDFIKNAKSKGVPVGPGRGSAAGSLVAYCTQITDIDPIPYNLLFERFLNPERISMPDVDIDFCMNRRGEALEYVAKKYGNVSQIITFGKMKAKGVLRDVGRVLDIELAQVDKIAKLVPNQLNITLEEALKLEPRLQDMMESDPQVNRLMEIARRLEGLNRHASTHAAGVVISDRPLTDFLPLYRGGNEDIVTQYDMKAVEKIGLIKFDFLGLKTLTIMQHAVGMIKETRGVEIDLLHIPIDDEKVYAFLGTGDAAGVFQLESDGMKDLLCRMKPSVFEDLIALVALYRPGPLGSGMVDDFVNRKQGKTPIVYDLPALKPILEDTYGVIVYQEQVMQIASALAGYSLGEADLLRRAMGKKKAEEMAAQRERFLKGAAERSINKEKSIRIFELMEKFAEYGFNKSHSAAYALVSYQTAYLKTHFLVEYMASILTHEMTDTDKVLYYIQDCRDHKLTVLPPDVNTCFHGFTVVDEKTIRYGLGAVKNVGEGAIEAIVEARKNKGGSFKGFFEFIESIDYKRVNRRVIESLIKTGALDTFGIKRKAMFDVIDDAMSWAVRRQNEARQGQASLFAAIESTASTRVGVALPEGPEWYDNEKLGFEKEAFGFYFSSHPLKSYDAEIRRVSTTDSFHARELPAETEATVAGMFSKHRVITTKKGARMAFATLEDLRGFIEVIFFPESFTKYADMLTQEIPVVIKGTIDRGEEGPKIIAKEAWLLTEFITKKTRTVHFRIPAPLFTNERLPQFHSILRDFSGNCRGFIHLVFAGEAETVMELPDGIGLEKPDVLTSRVNSLFETKVVEYAV